MIYCQSFYCVQDSKNAQKIKPVKQKWMRLIDLNAVIYDKNLQTHDIC